MSDRRGVGMRKADREIVDFEEILKIVGESDTMRLGIGGDIFPYVVPLSYGYEVTDGKLVFYFHCAKEGKKVALLEKNPAVCVEIDRLNGYVQTEKSVTADYESVIAFGYAHAAEGEEAVRGLELLLKHCNIEGHSAEQCAALGIVKVIKIEVERVSGKRRFRK